MNLRFYSLRLFNNYIMQREWVGLSVFHDFSVRKTRGEWYFMKNIMIKKIIKPFLYCCEEWGFHEYRKLMVNSVISMVIAFLQLFCICDHFHVRQFIENRDSNNFHYFFLNLTLQFSCLKTWVDVSQVGAYLHFFSTSKKRNK